jgi:FdhD protein
MRPPEQDDSHTGTAYSVIPTAVWNNGQLDSGVDCVADEVPVALEYNGISHVVMLASPVALEDFATGFSLTEGIVSGTRDIYEIQVENSEKGYTVKLTISPRCFFYLKERRRTLAGRTGCGLFGAESLDQVYQIPSPVTASNRFSPGILQQAFENLRNSQFLMQRTGATHAAAWIDATGRVALIREDVGRHNALDKLIGALAMAETPSADGAVLITSRASYEMVLKTAAADIGLLAAISAPTSLAIKLAALSGITLAGFVRDQRMLIYTHPERLRDNPRAVDVK